jgi:hypothetical protein
VKPLMPPVFESAMNFPNFRNLVKKWRISDSEFFNRIGWKAEQNQVHDLDRVTTATGQWTIPLPR